MIPKEFYVTIFTEEKKMNTKRELLKTYRNGNYFVRIYDDGTKVRILPSGNFRPRFPENIDLKITSYCDGMCPMCHENSDRNGIPASLTLPFLDTLQAGTELAIGGGNPLTHPDLESFLLRMKRQGVICNITVRQDHLFQKLDYVQSLIDRKLIYGIGISYLSLTEELLSFCKTNHNAVLHLILGIHGMQVLDELSDYGLKILLLGYKRFGRGTAYYSDSVEKRIREVKETFFDYVDRFEAISLDNEAMRLLEVESRISEKDFRKHFMGDEGQFTMYIDAVERKFAVNSVTEAENRQPLKDDVFSMFDSVRYSNDCHNQKKCI